MKMLHSLGWSHGPDLGHDHEKVHLLRMPKFVPCSASVVHRIQMRKLAPLLVMPSCNQARLHTGV